jgi:MoaA/NifB/PqqE/SkfB family radical SAM enzyme
LKALSYAGRMLVSAMTGRPRLFISYLLLTNRCNLRCTYCSSPYMKNSEMTTDQWVGVIDELASLGCGRVSITGGEPLLRPDVGEVLERARQRGMSSVLCSNGLLVKRRIEEVRLADTLVLSLDGVGHANDEVRGEGVFEAVKEAIEVAKSEGISVKVNAVLSETTAPGLDEWLDFVRKNEVCMTVNMVRSGAPGLWHEAASIKPADEEIRHTFGRLAEMARSDPRLLFSETTYRYGARWRDYSLDRLEEDELPLEDPLRRDGPQCQAGRYYIYIEPDGTVSPCINTVGIISGGDVLSGGVEGALRRLETHPCVACYTPCLVELNYLFSREPRALFGFLTRYLPRFD